MAQQRADTYLLCGLPGSLECIFKQAPSNAFSHPIRVHDEATQHGNGNGLRRIPPDSARCKHVRNRTSSQSVITDDVLLPIAYNKTSGSTIPVIFARSANEPFCKVG